MSLPPKNYIVNCGCSYGYHYEIGGPGCGPSGWERNDHPDYPCAMHKPAEDERLATQAAKQAEENQIRKEQSLKRLIKDEEKVRADANRKLEEIQRERYRIVHGHDPVKLQEQLDAAQKEIARITALQATLPPTGSSATNLF